MDLINHLLPKEKEPKLTAKELEFEMLAKEYTEKFGGIPYGLQYPEITNELLKKSLDDDDEIESFTSGDGVIY